MKKCLSLLLLCIFSFVSLNTVSAYDKNLNFSDNIVFNYVYYDGEKYISLKDTLKNDKAKVYFQSINKTKDEWNKINKLNIELQDLYNQKENINNNSSEQQKNVILKQNEITNKQNSITNMYNTLNNIDLTSIQEQIDNKQIQLSNLEEEYNNERNALENLKSEQNDLNNRLENARQQYNTAADNLSKSKADGAPADKIAELENIAYQRSQVVANLLNEYNSKGQEVSTKQNQVDTIYNNIQNTNNEISELQEEYNRQSNNEQTLQNNISTAQKELATLTSELTTLKTKENDYKEKVNNDIETKEAELRKLLDYNNNNWKNLKINKETSKDNRYSVNVSTKPGYYVDWVKVELDDKTYYAFERYSINENGETEVVKDENSSKEVKNKIEEDIKKISNSDKSNNTNGIDNPKTGIKINFVIGLIILSITSVIYFNIKNKKLLK